MLKINFCYFSSRARLNFRWIFKEFDLSNMKGFFENFLALSVKKLKKVLMILPSITGRGRAFLAKRLAFLQLMKNSKSQKNLKSCQLLHNSPIIHLIYANN